ncbi:MAG: asparagine synthase C-terminal domain-containing protein, partial [Hyphomicrobiales bacterium]|nr:asparagine synthase C-terminal domain-containing protein [Hyphomicrobiales bacterium]
FEAPLTTEDLYGDAIELWERQPEANLIDRSLEFFTRFYLQDNVLTKVDRASMMTSLETRAVFLDNDLVAFCQKLPHRFKFRNGQGKYLLKKAMAKVLPADTLKRPKKGFGIPVMRWLKDLPAVGEPLALPGMKSASVETAWREHRSGKADHRLFLWMWLALQHGLKGLESGR